MRRQSSGTHPNEPQGIDAQGVITGEYEHSNSVARIHTEPMRHGRILQLQYSNLHIRQPRHSRVQYWSLAYAQ